MDTSFTNIATSLFFVLNSIGQIPIFLALLRKFDQKTQLKIIFRELTISLAILVSFTFFGDWILKVLGISRPILSIAGGILLFLISLSMIFPKRTEAEQQLTQEPIIIPLAIPLIAGPGSISIVMMYAHATNNPLFVSAAVFTAWLPSLIILLVGSYVKKILGEKGLTAIERLGGMLICLISISLFTHGMLELVNEYFKIRVVQM
ncbi:MAG: MarC family protein [Chlamydiales bacterium]|nr:MarC family protein [Chlamydiales bacterium]MBY0415154.1 MarC family protein [Bdellovibrionales bacterium]